MHRRTVTTTINRRKPHGPGVFPALILILLILFAGKAFPDRALAAETGSGSFSLTTEAASLKKARKVTEKYYTQLNKNAKTVYRLLQKTNLRTKNAVWKVNKSFITTLSAAKSYAALQKTAGIAALYKAAEAGYYSYRMDQMQDCYWLGGMSIRFNYRYRQTGKNTAVVNVLSLKLTPLALYTKVLEDDAAVIARINAIVDEVRNTRASASRYDTLYALVRFMVINFNFGRSAYLTSYTPAGLLLSKYGNTGVCESYAKLFFILCRRLGIPVIYVESKEHAYNYVRMENGIWYGMDTSWVENNDRVNPDNMDMDWFLYGKQEAAANDRNNFHLTELRWGSASLTGISISDTAYPIPSSPKSRGTDQTPVFEAG